MWEYSSTEGPQNSEIREGNFCLRMVVEPQGWEEYRVYLELASQLCQKLSDHSRFDVGCQITDNPSPPKAFPAPHSSSELQTEYSNRSRGPRGRDLTLSKTWQPADDRNINCTYQTPSLNIWKRSWSEMGSSKSPRPRFPGTNREDGDGVGKRDCNPCRAELWAQQELKPVLAEAQLCQGTASSG